MPDIKNLKSMENRVLTTFSQGWNPQDMINRIVCPPIPVTRSQGDYMVDKNGLRLYDTERAPRTRAKTVDFEHGTSSWSTKDQWLSVLLDKDEIEEAQSTGLEALMNIKQDAVSLVMNLLEAKREKAVADRVMGTSYYHNDFQKDIASTPWNDQTNGDPIADIMEAVKAVRSVGAVANALVMSGAVYDALCVHPAMLDYFKMQMGRLTDAQILSMFRGVTRIVIGDATYNSGTEDAAVLTPYWGDHCAVVPINSLQELKQGRKAHTVVFDRLNAYKSLEHDEGETVRMIQKVEWGILTINTQHGYLIENAVAELSEGE